MKITVTDNSATLGNLLDSADVALIKQMLAAKDSITIVLYNAQSGQTVYVETLGKAATTTNGYPIPYQAQMGILVDNTTLSNVSLIGSSPSCDMRVLLNTLELSR